MNKCFESKLNLHKFKMDCVEIHIGIMSLMCMDISYISVGIGFYVGCGIIYAYGIPFKLICN